MVARRALALAAALSGLAPAARADTAPPPAAKAPVAGDTVVATLVDGDGPIIACGVIAFIGVYVYEIESAGPVKSRIVVDVLCPDFYLAQGVRFARGERVELKLGPARRTYASATPRRSPLPGAPRFAARKVGLPPAR
jgi:hypothetical protein